jgi:elongation factor P--beta-lysine ligase
MNKRAQWKARASVAEDEKMYQEIWKLVEKEEKPCKTALNAFCSSELTCKASDELLQDCSDIDILYSQAEFMNDAFQSLVSGLIETSVDKSTPKHSFAVLFPVSKGHRSFIANFDF